MNAINISVLNIEKLFKKLEKIPEKQNKVLQDALAEGVIMVHSHAVKSITAHQSSGITYGKHTASKEGFPPNSDTGQLVKSIGWEIDASKLIATVGTNLLYGAWLEFGTKNMGARPWLYPAYKANEKKIVALINRMCEKALK